MERDVVKNTAKSPVKGLKSGGYKLEEDDEDEFDKEFDLMLKK
jgi:hypothetical protein